MKKIVLSKYIIIVFISVIISLYVSEAYLLFFYEKQIQNYKLALYEKKSNKIFDKRNRLEIYNDLKSEDFTLTIAPSNHLNNNDAFNDQLFPLSGISNSQTIFCNENGYFSKYLSDRYGFNNPDQVWDKNTSIVLIGDSFVHGACVNRPDDISSQLRMISNKNIINLGYSGNSSLIQLATLKEYLKTDNVIVFWFFFENDIEELSYETKNEILKNYLIKKNFTQNLVDKQKTIDKMNKNILELSLIKKNFNLSNFIKLNKIRGILNDLLIYKGVNKDQILNFEKIINEANRFLKNKNSKLYFVYLDGYKGHQELKNNIKKLIVGNNIPFIDIKKEIENMQLIYTNIFPFKLPGHYNERGYALISQIISKKLNN